MKIVALILAGLLMHALLLAAAGLPGARLLRARHRHEAPRRAVAFVHTPAIDRVPLVYTQDEDIPFGPPPPPPSLARPKPSAIAKPAVTLLEASVVRATLERRIEQLPICRLFDGPHGDGRAFVSFNPRGTVSVKLSEPFEGTPIGDCIARRLGSAAAPYKGDAFSAEVAFTL